MNGPKEVTRYEWDWNDLQDFIKDLYGVDWDGQAAMDFPAQNTYSNYTIKGTKHSVTCAVNWLERVAEFEDASNMMDSFVRGECERQDAWPFFLPGLELLLEWLCYDGRIPEGDYTIKVWW
jgi:hypothetical protein